MSLGFRRLNTLDTNHVINQLNGSIEQSPSSELNNLLGKISSHFRKPVDLLRLLHQHAADLHISTSLIYTAARRWSTQQHAADLHSSTPLIYTAAHRWSTHQHAADLHISPSLIYTSARSWSTQQHAADRHNSPPLIYTRSRNWSTCLSRRKKSTPSWIISLPRHLILSHLLIL